MIFNMVGGGIAGLNFEVVGSTAPPINPKENTIWIETSEKITSWVISPEELVTLENCASEAAGGKTLYTLSGRGYKKVNDGFAVYTLSSGEKGQYWGPILVSPFPDAVSLTTTLDTSEIQTYAGTVEYNGTTYYYRRADYAMSGSFNVTPKYPTAIADADLALILAEQCDKLLNLEGVVWIKTSALSSETGFNALKKNVLNVYPLSAYQYVSCEQVEKNMLVYQNGEWVGTITDLYIVTNGVPNSDIGGGWDNSDVDGGTSGYTSGQYYVIKGNGTGYFARGFGPVDLTNYKTLIMEGTFTISNYDIHHCLAVTTKLQRPVSGNAAYAPYGASGTSIDVSGITGNHYIMIASVYTDEQKIRNLYLVP